MKEKISYILLVCVFIVLILSMTINHLLLNYSVSGSVKFSKSYQDIILYNAKLNEDDDSTIKINSDNDYIHIEIPNLNNYVNEKTFTVDLTNIGNIDVYVDDITYTNINKNVKNDVIVDVSLKKDEIIKGGESKKLYIKVKYNKLKEKITSPFYNFNVNFKFNEVPL